MRAYLGGFMAICSVGITRNSRFVRPCSGFQRLHDREQQSGGKRAGFDFLGQILVVHLYAALTQATTQILERDAILSQRKPNFLTCQLFKPLQSRTICSPPYCGSDSQWPCRQLIKLHVHLSPSSCLIITSSLKTNFPFQVIILKKKCEF